MYTQKILSNAQSIVVWWLAVIETGEGKQFLAQCYAKEYIVMLENTLLC